MIDAKAGHNVLQSRLDAALQSCVFFFFFVFFFTRNASGSGPEAAEGRGADNGSGLTWRSGEDFSHLNHRLDFDSFQRGTTPIFKKASAATHRNTLHSFLFTFGAHQV